MPAKQLRGMGPPQLFTESGAGPLDRDIGRAQSEPVVHLPHDRSEPGIPDAQITEHHLVNRECVLAGVDVTDVGRTVTAHDAERSVRHRRPGIDDGEVRRCDIEQHHGGGTKVDLPSSVERVVDRTGATLERRKAQMGELCRIRAQFRHDNTEIGIQPVAAHRLLNEAALVGDRAKVLADVDDTVRGRVESEIRRDGANRAIGICVAVDRGRLEDCDIFDAMTESGSGPLPPPAPGH